jgi:hypothetical protein
MGDGPEQGETHRTTIEITGPVSKDDFEAWKRELRSCIAKFKQYKIKIRLIECEKE